MNLLIFTATHYEALPIISRIKNAKKIKLGNFSGWQGTLNKDIYVNLFCTGIGIKKINIPVDKNSVVINIGIAGNPTNEFEVGDWLNISKVNNLNCNIIDKFKTATLVTVKEAVKKKKEAAKLNADLVDMEAFAVAKFAKKNNLKCYILKMVSDFADENFSDDCKNCLDVYQKTCFENLKYWNNP